MMTSERFEQLFPEPPKAPDYVRVWVDVAMVELRKLDGDLPDFLVVPAHIYDGMLEYLKAREDFFGPNLFRPYSPTLPRKLELYVGKSIELLRANEYG